MVKGLYRLEGRVCRNILKIIICFIVTWGGHGAMVAQGEVIDAGNIGRLESMSRVEFEAFVDQAGIIENGWFVMSDYPVKQGVLFALTNRNSEVVIWNEQSNAVSRYHVTGADGLPSSVIDMRFIENSSDFISLHSDGSRNYIAYLSTGDVEVIDELPLQEAIPQMVWGYIDAAFPPASYYTYVEMLAEQPYTLSFSIGPIGHITRIDRGSPDGPPIVGKIPSPHADPEAIIRIGRIAPPLAITVTEDGRVKRWHMETGEITAEVQVENALPIYGQINAGGDRYLVWRDPMSQALHLLDFETGEDRVVVALNGTYIPFIFLTTGADVIIGVDVDDEPVVVAWDVATGQQYHLGTYRQCNRPPDMARLSEDGTTLVIACDTGLDIWRVTNG
jgi:hypothetical protein